MGILLAGILPGIERCNIFDAVYDQINDF